MKLIKLDDQREYLRTITEQAAGQANDDGRASDAVLLYHLAEDFETVIEIINKNLSDSIASEDVTLGFSHQAGTSALPSAGSSLTSVDDPVQLAKRMRSMYANNAAMYSKISARSREAADVLLSIADAKMRYQEGKWESCLQVSIFSLCALGYDWH